MQSFLTDGFRMGKPALLEIIGPSFDLSKGKEPGELKHLSTQRKRDHKVFR